MNVKISESEQVDDGNDVHFFEGAEKLLEIVFENNTSGTGDLRKIPRCEIVDLLKVIRCEIVSHIRNDDIDAYVLSESSLFVTKQKLILKTCGTTTLLLALDKFLDLAHTYGHLTGIADFYYSRKNFLKPHLQLVPHRNFDQEKEFLDAFFKRKISGEPASCDFVFRPRSDHNIDSDSLWFLYTLNGSTGGSGSPRDLFDHDQTLEVLMTDLSPEVMSLFYQMNSGNGLEARRKSGIDQIIPDMVIDDYLFDPCGYSMNGITKNGHYMTIHVTPELEFSYVSFETNFPAVSYKDLVEFVTDLFEPKRFTVTVFTGKQSKSRKCLDEFDQCHTTNTLIGKCRKKTIEYRRLKNYDFLYACYSKFPS